jgi:hypothetical protein
MRRAMTLIELLVVITVIIALIAMLLPAVSVLREHSRQALTLRELEGLGGIITERLNEDGDLPADFDTRPAYHTQDVPPTLGRKPQLELAKEQRSGDKILDGYGIPLVIEIVRASNLGKPYIARVTIASQGRKQSALSGATAILADAVANKDDLVFVYDTAKEARFVRVVR